MAAQLNKITDDQSVIRGLILCSGHISRGDYDQTSDLITFLGAVHLL